jgi:hypothetical protein
MEMITTMTMKQAPDMVMKKITATIMFTLKTMSRAISTITKIKGVMIMIRIMTMIMVMKIGQITLQHSNNFSRPVLLQ